MSKVHNELGQLVVYDVETGLVIKFNKWEYEKFLSILWVREGIKPNYNFNKGIQDEKISK
jgi:hypothetical protein